MQMADMSHCAGDAGVPVMRNGRPYMRNGMPVRLPLQDTTNVLEGQDIQRIATMCYVQASQVIPMSMHVFAYQHDQQHAACQCKGSPPCALCRLPR